MIEWKSTRMMISSRIERFSGCTFAPEMSHARSTGLAHALRAHAAVGLDEGPATAESHPCAGGARPTCEVVTAIGDEDEGCHAGGGEDQHRELAHGVPAAEVDESDVDDVATVTDLVGEGRPLERDGEVLPRAVATIATRAIVRPRRAEHGTRERGDRLVLLAHAGQTP